MFNICNQIDICQKNLETVLSIFYNIFKSRHLHIYLGFKYIKDLIEGKTEVHHDSNRNLLRLVTPDLVNRLDARPFLDHAYEKELLTDDDKSEIDAELQNHGENKAISVTLERVVKYKEDWNTILIDIFKQKEFCLWDIADLFEFIMQSKPEVSIKGIYFYVSYIYLLTDYKTISALVKTLLNTNGIRNMMVLFSLPLTRGT